MRSKDAQNSSGKPKTYPRYSHWDKKKVQKEAKLQLAKGKNASENTGGRGSSFRGQGAFSLGYAEDLRRGF